MKETEQPDFTHLDASDNPQMVDVGQKVPSLRIAKARAKVKLTEDIIAQFNNKDIQSKKGPVFQTAILAGIMAAKKTGDLIPLCHPLPIENCEIDIRLEGNMAIIIATSSITAKTGVEMEALTAASIAALTIYDMCKAISHGIEILEIKLLAKTGGKNDYKAE